MKVAIATQTLAVRGGTQKQVLRLGEDLRRRGVCLQLLTFEYTADEGYESFRDLNVKVVRPAGASRWLSRVRGHWSAALRMVQAIDPDTDILNIHDIGCEWVLLLAKLRYPHLRIVWQINDLHPAFRVGPFQKLRSKWTHPIHRVINRVAGRVANAVVVNVGKNRERVKECLWVNSHLFFPGVDQVETAPKIRDRSEPLSLLSTGVFYRYRNYEAIVRATACLQTRGFAARLTIVGTTKYDEAYAREIGALASQLGVDLSVTGEIPDLELKRILDSADLFLFPNVDQSWGLAVFEAMSASIPAILSKSAGAAELLADRPGVFSVDAQSPEKIASAIVAAVSDPERYRQLRRAAFETVSQMTWTNMYCREMWGLFAQLVHRSGRQQLSIDVPAPPTECTGVSTARVTIENKLNY